MSASNYAWCGNNTQLTQYPSEQNRQNPVSLELRWYNGTALYVYVILQTYFDVICVTIGYASCPWYRKQIVSPNCSRTYWKITMTDKIITMNDFISDLWMLLHNCLRCLRWQDYSFIRINKFVCGTAASNSIPLCAHRSRLNMIESALRKIANAAQPRLTPVMKDFKDC